MDRMRPTITIRSTIGRVGCMLVTVAGLLACVDEGWHHGFLAALRVAGPALLLVAACWGMWGWPRLVVSDDGLLVDNALRRISVPWSALRRPRVHWGLVLDTDAGTVRAAAAPLKGGTAMPGRMAGMSRRDRLAAEASKSATGLTAAPQDAVILAALADRPVTVSIDASNAYALLTQRQLAITEDPAVRTPASQQRQVHRSWRWGHIVMVVLGALGTCWVLLG